MLFVLDGFFIVWDVIGGLVWLFVLVIIDYDIVYSKNMIWYSIVYKVYRKNKVMEYFRNYFFLINLIVKNCFLIEFLNNFNFKLNVWL